MTDIEQQDELQIEIGHSSLGLVLVAVSPKGIRAVQLGDNPLRLRQELENRFPEANLKEGDDDSRRLASNVVKFIDSSAELDSPLDIRGTDFQRTVWQTLREIPPGSTMSYSELAKEIGKPSAVRAVAHACAENALAVIIPCHRAVRRDGSLAGYRWGLERKRMLLDRELANQP